MRRDAKFPILSFALFAVPLTVLSGLATQLCIIGHGGILPVTILTPYAALLILGDFYALALWVAILQFPLYAIALSISYARGIVGRMSSALLLAHCLGVVIAFARAF